MKSKKERKPPNKVLSVTSLFGVGVLFAVTVFLTVIVAKSSIWIALLCGACAVLCLLVPAKLLKAYEFTPKKADPQTVEENNEKGE